MRLSMAMLKAKEDKREAASVVVVAKKDQAKDKRARDTTALVTIGSEIMKRLEQLGPSELHRLKIDELHASLVNANPQGSIPKPNKKTGQEKASLLSIVPAALTRFFSGSSSIYRAISTVAPNFFCSIDLRGRKKFKFVS